MRRVIATNFACAQTCAKYEISNNFNLRINRASSVTGSGVIDDFTSGFLVMSKINNFLHKCLLQFCLQCFDAVGWAAGRASGL